MLNPLWKKDQLGTRWNFWKGPIWWGVEHSWLDAKGKGNSTKVSHQKIRDLWSLGVKAKPPKIMQICPEIPMKQQCLEIKNKKSEPRISRVDNF